MNLLKKIVLLLTKRHIQIITKKIDLFAKVVTKKRKAKTIRTHPLEMKSVLHTNNQKSKMPIITKKIELSS